MRRSTPGLAFADEHNDTSGKRVEFVLGLSSLHAVMVLISVVNYLDLYDSNRFDPY